MFSPTSKVGRDESRTVTYSRFPCISLFSPLGSPKTPFSGLERGRRLHAHPQEPNPDTRADESEDWVLRAIDEFNRGISREENFRRIYDLYYDTVHRFFCKRVFSPDDCLDLTQETFLGIYKGLESYRGDARFGTWVFRIALNTHLKRLRRARAREGNPDVAGAAEPDAVALDDGEIVVVSPERTALDEVLRSEERVLLRRAVEELPDQMQRCMKLRIYQNRSYKEIATVVQRSIETVKAHVFQGSKKLKEKLSEVEKLGL